MPKSKSTVRKSLYWSVPPFPHRRKTTKLMSTIQACPENYSVQVNMCKVLDSMLGT